jgi:chromosomal replication initiator protein
MAVAYTADALPRRYACARDMRRRSQQEVVMEDSQVAAALSAELTRRIGPQRFELWFKTQSQQLVEGNCLTVRAANAFVLDWVKQNLADHVRASWETVVGQDGTVVFDVGAAVEKCNGKVTGETVANGVVTEAVTDVVAVAKPRAAGKATKSETPTLNGVVELSAFVVGSSNEYAFRAAELTGRGRQQASPLLLCGPSGVGKTHLLRAVVREYRRHHPRSTAVYLSAEQFTTGFLEALRGSGLPSFRQKCRGAKLLAIDDLQFFPGKRRTIEELLHTFDAMSAEGRQLVLASDRGLNELRAIGPELISRLSGGLICEMESPEFTTRVGILRRMRDESGLAIDDSVLTIVATQITAGARELRGALNRLEAMSHAYGEPIGRELTERALADLARHSTRTVRLGDVEKVVCDVFGIEPTHLRSDRKGRSLSEPRMLGMWLARKYTRAPWSEIGEFFGRRSHSTVISAHRRVEKLITDHAQIGLANQSCNVEDAIRKLETALRTA